MAISNKPWIWILLSAMGFSEAFEMPKGWALPQGPAFEGAWRDASPTRYLSAGADVDCDGFTDSVMILQPADGIGLFVFLQDGKGSYKPRKVFTWYIKAGRTSGVEGI